MFSIKMHISKINLILSILLLAGCKQENQQKGFTPADAYIEGSELTYYGSENPWDHRFFTEHIKDKYKRNFTLI